MYIKTNIPLHTKRGSGGEAPGKILGVNNPPPLLRENFSGGGGDFINRSGVSIGETE